MGEGKGQRKGCIGTETGTGAGVGLLQSISHASLGELSEAARGRGSQGGGG